MQNLGGQTKSIMVFSGMANKKCTQSAANVSWLLLRELKYATLVKNSREYHGESLLSSKPLCRKSSGLVEEVDQTTVFFPITHEKLKAGFSTTPLTELRKV